MRRKISWCLPPWERPNDAFQHLTQQRNMALTNVSSGCTKVTKVLTAVNQEATIWCAGQAKVGIGISNVTGTPTLSFFGSTDGLQFNPLTVGAYPSATPPAAGVTTVTATGNYEVNVQNYMFIRAQMTNGSGPATVVLAASVDNSYQEAFFVGQSGVNLSSTLYPSTTSTSGTNTMAIPGQANRTVNLTFLEVSLAGGGFGANAQLRIWDGSVGNGVPLFQDFITSPVGSVGTQQKINLPTDAQGNIGLQGTPGNGLVVQIVNLGSTAACINARASMI
jgi:hypothetical protein